MNGESLLGKPWAGLKNCFFVKSRMLCLLIDSSLNLPMKSQLFKGGVCPERRRVSV